MAKVTTRGKRKPIAEGRIESYGWANTDHGETFSVLVNTTRVSLTRAEAEALVRQFTKMLSNPEYAKAAGLNSNQVWSGEND